MKALGVKDRFIPSILDGSKPITLRRVWRNGKTPDLGEKLSLVAGSRTPARRVFASCVVGFRATILFRSENVVGLVNKRALATWSTESRRVFLAAEAAAEERFADKFASLDGFATFAEFWRFHGHHRAASASEVAERELIGLVAVTEAFTDA